MRTALTSTAFLLSTLLAGGAVAQHEVNADCKTEYAYKKKNNIPFDRGLEKARETLQLVVKLHGVLPADDIILVKCESEDAVYAYEGPIKDDQGADFETGRYIFVNQPWVDRTIGADHIQELALYAHEFDHLKDEHFTRNKKQVVKPNEIAADRFAACTVAHHDPGAWRSLRDFFIRMRPVKEGTYASREQTLLEAADAFRDCNGVIPPSLDPKRPYKTNVFLTPVLASTAMSEADLQAGMSLYGKVIKLAGPTLKYLRPSASLRKEAWMSALGAQLFDPNVPWNQDSVGKALENYITNTIAGDNLKNVGVDKIYWIFIGITPGNVIKSALVVIDINSGVVETHEPLKIYPPVLGESFSVTDSSEDAVTDVIVRGLLKFIVPKSQGLVRNRMIFPSCILRLEDAGKKQLRAPIGFLGRQITDVLSDRKEDARYQSVLDECFVRESGKSDDDYWPVARLAEFIIELTFTSEQEAWEVRPSWDNPDYKGYRSPPNQFNLADCQNQLNLWLAKFREKWDSIIQAAQNDPNK